MKLNESVALVPLTPLLFTAGISLQYFHKLPDTFEQLSLYYIKIYIGITISISLALSTWVLLILLMQSVNGAQLLNITFLPVLFAPVPAPAVLLTDISPLTSIYASL